MSEFRIAVIGAADIANKFCNAVSYIDGAKIVAVGSRSAERAKAFAQKNQIPAAYGDYEEMLVTEKPDAAYIAVTTNAHYDMCLLCIKHKVPFLCEKTMCTSVEQTVDALSKAKAAGIFSMEAMWSRFLPAINTAKKWIVEGKIGNTQYASINVGFQAAAGDDNRFWNPKLGGGVAFDLTVYAYEIMTYMIEKEIKEVQTASAFYHTGVDASNHITLVYEDMLASLNSSIAVRLEEKMVIDGELGRIVVPVPHFASEAILYDKSGKEMEHFVDQETPNGNGFYHEAKELMRCVQSGALESVTVPHALTIEYARVAERLLEKK